MQGTQDLEQMLHALQREPWMTALHRRLLLDTRGDDTAALHGRLQDVTAALAAAAPENLAARRDLAAAGSAAATACTVLRYVWQLLHGRPLPAPRADPGAAATSPPTDDGAARGLPALLQMFAEIAVLAALSDSAAAGERIRASLAALVPDFRDHEVPYALALMFNGRHGLAESILAAHLDADDDGGRRRCAYALVRLARGATDWQRELERVIATSNDADVRQAATHWMRLLQIPLAA